MNEHAGPHRSPKLAPRFSLRVLLIVMLLAGPLGAFGWKQYHMWRERQIQHEAELRLRRERAAAALAISQLSGQFIIDRDGANPEKEKVTRHEDTVSEDPN